MSVRPIDNSVDYRRLLQETAQQRRASSEEGPIRGTASTATTAHIDGQLDKRLRHSVQRLRRQQEEALRLDQIITDCSPKADPRYEFAVKVCLAVGNTMLQCVGRQNPPPEAASFIDNLSTSSTTLNNLNNSLSTTSTSLSNSSSQ